MTPVMYLLSVSYEGEMEYGLYSTLDKAKAEAVKTIEERPYGSDGEEQPPVKFKQRTHYTGDLVYFWEETPMRVEILPMPVDSPLGEF